MKNKTLINLLGMFMAVVLSGLSVDTQALADDNSSVKKEAAPASVSSGIEDALTMFRPTVPNGSAILICPGGGYEHLAMEHEGTEVAEWLSSNGFTCAVLRYRFPKGNCTVPSDDSRKAIRYLRGKASELGICPDAIGIMGFSAGGHLAATTATLSDSLSRPDFQILMYPVISMDDSITHAGSRRNLLGDNPSERSVKMYSLEEQVDATAPPAIIILSADDDVVDPRNSLRYFEALRRNHVPVSMFIYPSGGHGWGMRDSFIYKGQWTSELQDWLNRL